MKTRRMSRRQLDARSLRKYRDARMVRSVRRFNDGFLQTLGEKLHAATEKAIAWCKEKKEEHPKLAKVIVVLLKIRAASLAISGGAGISLSVLSKFREDVRGGIQLAGQTPLKVLLISIYGILKAIAGFVAANKIEQL